MHEQLDLLSGVPLRPPMSIARAAGEEAAERCLAKAKRVSDFDADGAGKFICSWLDRHGQMSGEDLVEAAKAHGFRGHDDRCFGGVFQRLVNHNQIRVIRSDLPRKRGNGTSGGKLYGRVR
jgi:hypothetical protein